MNLYIKHIALPAVAPAAIVALYLTPAALVGCVNRGLMALAVVFVSLCAGIFAAVQGRKAQAAHDAVAAWWVASALILALPALLLWPLG